MSGRRARRAPPLGAARAAIVTVVALAVGAPASIVASGCGSAFHPADASDDASAAEAGLPDGAPAPVTDSAAGDASACAAVVASDPHNCGRCGHDCLGGSCSAGLCAPVELGTVGAQLRHVLLTGSTLFASSTSTLAGSPGIWRVPTSGGSAEAFVTDLGVGGMAVLDAMLYFVVNDAPADGVSAVGGLYACAVTAPAPCTPTLIAPSADADAVAVDAGHVFYTDSRAGRGLMVYAPPDAPKVYATNDSIFGFADDIYVDGPLAFATTNSGLNPNQHANLFAVSPDGGTPLIASYTSDNATAGRLVGSKDALYFTAYEVTVSAGGLVHRILRGTGAGCDFAPGQVARPFGVHADDAHVFWVNQGVGTDTPYTGSTLAACPVSGCCTTAQILWTGDGQATDLTGDDQALYFVGSADGSIWRLAKP